MRLGGSKLHFPPYHHLSVRPFHLFFTIFSRSRGGSDQVFKSGPHVTDRDCSQIAPWARAVQFLSSEPRRTGRSTCCLTRICKAKPLHPHLPLPALLIPPARACLRCGGGDYVKLMRRPPFLGSVFAPPLLFLSASGAFRASDSLLCSPIASCCFFALHLG